MFEFAIRIVVARRATDLINKSRKSRENCDENACQVILAKGSQAVAIGRDISKADDVKKLFENSGNVRKSPLH